MSRPTETSSIEPGGLYTVASLAQALEVSERYLYDLCRSGLLRHQRSRPGSGRIRVRGSAWLDYARRCEQGGDPEGTREATPEPEPVKPPRPARRRPPVSDPVDPLVEYERAAGRRA